MALALAAGVRLGCADGAPGEHARLDVSDSVVSAEPPRSELELSARVAAPPWIADVGLGVVYRRTWAHRGERYMEQVVETAGVDASTLESQMEADEGSLDVFMSGLQRVSQVADEDYRDTIARVVASALTDDARIDEMAYLCAQVVSLEPAHLRALRAFLFKPGPEREASPRRTVQTGIKRRAHLKRIAAAAEVSEALTVSLCSRLESAGFLERAAPKVKSQSSGTSGSSEPDVTVPSEWGLTRWGVTVLEIGVLGLVGVAEVSRSSVSSPVRKTVV